MNIGFIGLGIMGRPMALRLAAAGHTLKVWARRPEACAALVEAGAQVRDNPRDVAEYSEVIITIVSDTPDVQAVILNEDGILAGARPGTTLVDMSTIDPGVTRELAAQLAQKGVAMLDAPVSGGEQGAIDGTLSIMVGGEEAVFRRTLPLFECLGKRITHIGGHGAGQVAKACNQILAAQQIAAVAETLLLARAAGVDPARVREALLGGFASSRVLEIHGQRMLEEDFKPGFKARLHAKDMRIALHTAQEAGLTLPGAAAAAELIGELLAGGQGELDSSALYQVLERLSGG